MTSADLNFQKQPINKIEYISNLVKTHFCSEVSYSLPKVHDGTHPVLPSFISTSLSTQDVQFLADGPKHSTQYSWLD